MLFRDLSPHGVIICQRVDHQWTKMQVSNPTVYIPLESLILKDNTQIFTMRLMIPDFNGFMHAMKKQDRVILHREKLHKEVWQTPVRQLAKKYGMSDVGLAKVCRRMDIPLPPRGYWAKQAYGYDVDKQPLPPTNKKSATQAMALDKSAEELLQVARNRASSSKVRYTERQRIHRLQNELKDWEMSHRIRAYIDALQASGRAGDADQAEFLAWAETYANHLDPTVDFRIEALEEA